MSDKMDREEEHFHDSDEEQDEFVVIKQESPRQPISGEEEHGRDTPICYVEKSQPVSECGPEVADVGAGLDCGQSVVSSPFDGSRRPSGQMTSSMVSGHSQAILDSMYTASMYGNLFADTNQVEKLVEVMKGESEKNRSVLDQIHTMITELSKEKSNNNDLRDKLANVQKQLEEEAKKSKELECTLAEFKAKLNKDAEERHNLLESLNRLSNAHAEKDTEVDKLEHKLYQLTHENTQLKQALEEANHELEHKTVESSNQAEIINVLQEENVESHRLVEKTRLRYRERLDSLEKIVAATHARNEVNFP